MKGAHDRGFNIVKLGEYPTPSLPFFSCPLRRRRITDPTVRSVSMTFRAIILARIRKTDATNERSAVRINRERLLVSTAFPVRLGVALFSFSPSDAQKAEPSTRGYLRDRLLYRHNPRGAYLGFLCLSVADSLFPSAPPPLCLSFTHSSPCRFSSSRPRNT